MNGDDSDYAIAGKITSHERASESLVRFNVKLKRFAQHLPLCGFAVHKFPIIGRALVKKLKFITIKPSLLTPCFRWFMCEPRATWFWKWKQLWINSFVDRLGMMEMLGWISLPDTLSRSHRVRVMPRRLFLIQLSQQVKALKSTFENPKHFSGFVFVVEEKSKLIAELRRKEIQSESDPKQHQLSVKLTSIIFDYQTRVNHESSSFRFLVYGPRSSPPRSDLLKAH